jgi:hypothetical protein
VPHPENETGQCCHWRIIVSMLSASLSKEEFSCCEVLQFYHRLFDGFSTFYQKKSVITLSTMFSSFSLKASCAQECHKNKECNICFIYT